MTARTAAVRCHQCAVIAAISSAAVTGGASTTDGVRRVMMDNALGISSRVMADGAGAPVQCTDRRSIGASLAGIVAIIGIDMAKHALIPMETDNHISIGCRVMTGSHAATCLSGGIPTKGVCQVTAMSRRRLFSPVAGQA